MVFKDYIAPKTGVIEVRIEKTILSFNGDNNEKPKDTGEEGF